MKAFPLLFSYRDLIPGEGFFAGVEVHGRALLEEDAEGAWMYGLNPGGLAGGGKTRKEALAEFRSGYTSVLLDMAQLSTSFAEFEVEVVRFFNNECKTLEKSWQEAVYAVRRGEVDTDWLNKHPFALDQIRVLVVEVVKAEADASSLPTAELAA